MKFNKDLYEQNTNIEINTDVLKIRVFLANQCKIGNEKKRSFNKSEIVFISGIIFILISLHTQNTRQKFPDRSAKYMLSLRDSVKSSAEDIFLGLCEFDLEIKSGVKKIVIHKPFQAIITDCALQVTFAFTLLEIVAVHVLKIDNRASSQQQA